MFQYIFESLGDDELEAVGTTADTEILVLDKHVFVAARNPLRMRVLALDGCRARIT